MEGAQGNFSEVCSLRVPSFRSVFIYYHRTRSENLDFNLNYSTKQALKDSSGKLQTKLRFMISQN